MLASLALAGALFILAAGTYFTPATIAFARRMPNAGWILVINALTGWTAAGWIVALVLALARPAPEASRVQVFNTTLVAAPPPYRGLGASRPELMAPGRPEDAPPWHPPQDWQ
jgi:hypothetical protein